MFCDLGTAESFTILDSAALSFQVKRRCILSGNSNSKPTAEAKWQPLSCVFGVSVKKI